jgi:hypothetical protein
MRDLKEEINKHRNPEKLIEILEMKSSVFQVKISIQSLAIRVEQVESRVSMI